MLPPLALVFLAPLGTYLFTLGLFRLIAHAPTFAAGDSTLANALLHYAVSGAAVRFKGIGFNFVLLSGAGFIRRALSTSHFDWNKISAPLFGGMFGGPQKIVDALTADDSGIGLKPYPGSKVHLGRRLMRNQVVFFSDAFSRTSLDELVPRFVQSVEKWCKQSKVVKEEWIELPDLYTFIKEVGFTCGIEAFFGSEVLRLNPDLAQDFWPYDDDVVFLALGLPEWFRPAAMRARNKCLDAMKRWRRNAEEKTDPTIPDNAGWDPAWGLGAIRRRNKLLHATEGLFDEDEKASMDLALLWTLTSNVIPASFWYLMEVLGNEDILKRVRKEIESELGTTIGGQTTHFEPAMVTNNALLQAIYAETLRLHVATLITRAVKKSHAVGCWILEKGQDIIVSSHVEHMHQQWDTTSSDSVHPAAEFYPDRFLSISDGKPTFSLDGRQGQWIPFGLGEHMCPGRHFAKQEMIINTVIMLVLFDFELMTPKGWRPANSYGRYGFGTQQPKEKVPFRVRRRQAV